LAIRIGALAKELGVESRVLVERAQQLGLNVTSHISLIDDADAEHLRRMLKGGRTRVEKKPPIVVAPPPPAPPKPVRKAEKKEAPAKGVRKKPAEAAPPATAAAPPAEAAAPPKPPRKRKPEEIPAVPEIKVGLAVKEKIGAPPPAAPAPTPPVAVKPVAAPAAPKVAAHAKEKAAAVAPAHVVSAPPPSRPAAPHPPAPAARPSAPAPRGGIALPPTGVRPPVERPAAKPPVLMKMPSRPLGKPPMAPLPPVIPVVGAPTTRVEVIEAKFAERLDEQRRRGKVVRKVSPVKDGDEAPTMVKAGQAPARRSRRPMRRWTSPSAPRVEVPRATKFDLEEPVTVKSFSETVGVKANAIIAKLLQQNVVATMNHTLDGETVQKLAGDFKVQITLTKLRDLEEELLAAIPTDRPEDLKHRPPVVTFLGHVDHGKTSLLDYIRKSHVTEGEAGGITQHIGAYKVERNNRSVVFLDTPGHEAFTAMRARGANVTDVVVLVVAADDGVQPQTEEAISHARAAKVPIVVAINKCDKPTANPLRVKQQLVGLDLTPEEWGGTTVCVEVSALTGKGVDDLLEMLALEAELLELKANPSGGARGTVLEARVSQERGAVATVLVRNGTLRRGDVMLAGHAWGRVRAMADDRGRLVKEAGPATPVEVYGLSQVPDAGDNFIVLRDAEKVRVIAEDRARRKRLASLVAREHVTLENLYARIAEGNVQELPVVLKADVKGSIEVLQKQLSEIGTKEVKIHILHSGVGGITQSDVLLADASDAIIIGFHVVPEESARRIAEEKGVDIRLYEIIYEVVGDLKKALSGMLAPEKKEVVIGHAHIRNTFKVSKVGTVAGCFLTDGRIVRNASIRLIRENVVIYTGKMASLKRFKDDVREVREGFECGLKIEGYDDIKVGDVIEAFEVHEVARTVV
jgi:translation initiation factor IF-2